MEIIKDPDGTIRCPKTLALLGHWFTVKGVTYAMYEI